MSDAVAQGYTLLEVQRLLGLSRAVLTGMIAAGFVSPSRGARREYVFTFKDLVVLRAAQGLSQANLPPARVVRSLKRLRAKLPDRMPLAGLRIAAVGDAVVVSEGASQWRPDDGQYLLQFEVAAPGGRLAFEVPMVAPTPVEDTADVFERALELEASDPEAAAAAYRQVLDRDPRDRDAYVNLGRLLHERGQLGQAALVYREGLAHCAADATLHYNLAVLQEDLGETRAAVDNYLLALAQAPDLADAHFNLARMYEAAGSQKEALRHWSAYRKLTRRR